jgi:hypothetical protein
MSQVCSRGLDCAIVVQLHQGTEVQEGTDDWVSKIWVKGIKRKWRDKSSVMLWPSVSAESWS